MDKMGILLDKAEWFTLKQRERELEKALRRTPDWHDNVTRQNELDVIRERLTEIDNKTR